MSTRTNNFGYAVVFIMVNALAAALPTSMASTEESLSLNRVLIFEEHFSSHLPARDAHSSEPDSPPICITSASTPDEESFELVASSHEDVALSVKEAIAAFTEYSHEDSSHEDSSHEDSSHEDSSHEDSSHEDSSHEVVSSESLVIASIEISNKNPLEINLDELDRHLTTLEENLSPAIWDASAAEVQHHALEELCTTYNEALSRNYKYYSSRVSKTFADQMFQERFASDLISVTVRLDLLSLFTLLATQQELGDPPKRALLRLAAESNASGILKYLVAEKGADLFHISRRLNTQKIFAKGISDTPAELAAAFGDERMYETLACLIKMEQINLLFKVPNPDKRSSRPWAMLTRATILDLAIQKFGANAKSVTLLEAKGAKMQQFLGTSLPIYSSPLSMQSQNSAFSLLSLKEEANKRHYASDLDGLIP